MAGDWIKMRTDLQTHPKVVRISSALNADNLRTVGGLHAVWSIFDAHSIDGSLEGYTVKALDGLLSWPGFSEAMQSVGWLEVSAHSLALPRFSEHNGKGAKRRSTETERKRASRSSADCPKPVRKMSARNADKKRTREEKRREDINTPQPPKGASGSVSLKTWADAVKAAGEKLIPEDDPVFAYSDDAGLPRDFLDLAWVAFKRRYTVQHPGKRYKDWRRVFRNYVEGNWGRLWFVDDSGGYALTATGKQAQRALQVAS